MRISQHYMKSGLSSLIIILLFAVFPIQSIAQTVTVGNLKYTLNSATGEAECAGPADGFTESSDGLTIPSSVTYSGEQYTVTSVGEMAFRKFTGLYGTLTLPNTLVSIGTSAFSGCTGLYGALTLPNSLTSVGDYAFLECSFTGSLIIPDSVTSIGAGAFYMCSGFTGSLTIPNTVP